MIPAWASERIAREVDEYLAHATIDMSDDPLTPIACRLRAWPVYGDIGGALMLDAGGTVFCCDNNTLEVRPETNRGWQLLALVIASRRIPELRALLPPRSAASSDCSACNGTGQVEVGPGCQLWCGVCWGLGWRREDVAIPDTAPDCGDK